MIVTTHGAAQPGAPGLYGGYPCALNSNVILRDADTRERFAATGRMRGEADVSAAGREVLEAKARTTLAPGDVLITRNEGGPGYGDPLRRDPEAVAADLRAGLCTPEDATAIYGVAVKVEDGTSDPLGTAALRSRIRTQRLADAIPVSDAIARYGAEGVAIPS